MQSMAQQEGYLFVVGSPAVATVFILGNCVGWYFESIVGVQMRISICHGVSFAT